MTVYVLGEQLKALLRASSESEFGFSWGAWKALVDQSGIKPLKHFPAFCDDSSGTISGGIIVGSAHRPSSRGSRA